MRHVRGPRIPARFCLVVCSSVLLGPWHLYCVSYTGRLATVGPSLRSSLTADIHLSSTFGCITPRWGPSQQTILSLVLWYHVRAHRGTVPGFEHPGCQSYFEALLDSGMSKGTGLIVSAVLRPGGNCCDYRITGGWQKGRVELPQQ